MKILLRFVRPEFLILLLVACSSVETEKGVAKRMDTVMGEQGPEVRESFSVESDPSAVEVDWLKRFKSPQLEKLVEEAQQNNRNLQATAAQVERARAMAIKAGALLKPTLSAGFSGGSSGLVEGSSRDEFGLSAQVSWEVDIWGKLAAGRRGAEASATSAEADFVYAQHAIAAATAKAYFVGLEAYFQEQLASENIKTLEEVTRIVQLQYENGLADAQDLALAKSDLALTRASLEEVKLSRRDALRALELLLGRYPGAELELANEMPDLPPSPPVGLPSELLERRPDVIAAERRVAAAFEETARARAARLPSLSLTGSLGSSSTELGNLLDPTNLAWQAAGNLLAPILDGGARKADLAAANASQNEAVAAYAQTALEAFSEVETFLDQGSSLSRRTVQINEAADESERALRIAELRHKEGESALIDVLTVQQRVEARKSQAINIQRLQLEQRVNLYLALGGDW